MKKFLLNSVLFSLSATIGYCLLIIVWGEIFLHNERPNLIYRRAGYGHTLSRLNDAKVVNHTKVLFLGSSHAYRGFDVRYMHRQKINAFNLGTSAQTAEVTEVLLNRYLDSIKPKLVIIEVAPTVFNLDGVEAALDVLANDTIDLNAAKLAVRVNNLRVYNTLIYAYYRGLRNRDSKVVEKKIKGRDTYRKNGYVERKVTYFKKKSYSPRKYTFRDDQLAALNRIISKLKRRDLPYILVQAPVTRGIYERYTNRQEFESMIKEMGPYYDFNKLVKLDDSLHFYDAFHLNQQGVEIFNQKLIHTLRLDTVR